MVSAHAESIRVATFNVELARDGPGLLLRDILRGVDQDILLVAGIIAHVAPDILVITGFDYDLEGHALNAFSDLVAGEGHTFDHLFALAPNSGLQTEFDLNGDGRTGGPRDAQGYGEFRGQGGMAILSRFPIVSGLIFDFSTGLWADLPDALIEKTEFPHIRRLSSVGHWLVPVALTETNHTALLVWHATPPVFDGPEDLNGRRNHDETVFWSRLISGDLPYAAPEHPFIILGDANLDPIDGDGRSSAINELLNHPLVQDPSPRGQGGVSAAGRDGGINLRHSGDAALDTVDWSDTANGPGNLRVDYVLPSVHWRIIDSAVFWPTPDDPEYELLGDGGNGASRHRLVWVDLMLESDP